MKEIMTDTFSAISRIEEGKGIEITPVESGEIYQILRYNDRYYLIDSLNGLLLDSENVEDIKKEITDIFVAEGYTTVSKEPSITEDIDADNDLSRHYCSVEMFDDEGDDEFPPLRDIEEPSNEHIREIMERCEQKMKEKAKELGIPYGCACCHLEPKSDLCKNRAYCKWHQELGLEATAQEILYNRGLGLEVSA